MKIKLSLIITTIIASIFIASCSSQSGTDGMKKIAEKKEGNVNVSILNEDGQLKNGKQNIVLAFTDADGKPIAIESASLNFQMPAMGSMAEMNDPATLSTTSTQGQFSGTVEIEMVGDWNAQIAWEGAESGKTTIPVKAS